MGFLSGVSSFIEKHSEAVHAVLDVAGFIPVVGTVADIANTALYIHEGDVGNAVMCGIAAIPGIGGLASLARKSYNAFKTSKTGIKLINALKKYKGVEKYWTLWGKMKTGARGLSRLSEGFEKLSGHIKNLLKRGCMDGRCFTGDTLVPTKHGYTAIKEIQKGDEIFSSDEKTGRTGFKEVEDVFTRTVHTIYHVWLDGKEEIKTTAGHPVYVQEQGWVAAINLREGDTLETMEGTASITKIVKDSHNFKAQEQPANSSADLLNPDGSVKQRRYYDGDGNAKMDIDFNHTDDGTHEFPHIHIWDWSQKNQDRKAGNKKIHDNDIISYNVDLLKKICLSKHTMMNKKSIKQFIFQKF